MMRINKNIMKLALAAVLLFTTACSDSLEDINISPNNLPDKEVDIKYVLTGILTKSAQISTNLTYESGELSAATQYLQRDFTSYEENNYQWGAKDFSNFYEPIKDSNYIFQRAELEKSGETKNYYQAVALIMKSYWFGFMTSSFGDMPYTNALQAEKGGDEFFKPVYDEQKVIFSGILQDLEQANTLLKNAGVCAEAVDADVMYQGNALKWRKFANSLRLRFYMRLSEKTSTDFDPAANIAKMVNNSGEYPVLDSNESNASISFVGTDDVNSWVGGPLYFSFRSEFYRRKPSATIVNDLKALGDPRLTAWVRPVDIQIMQGTSNEVILEDGALKRYVDFDITAINNDEDEENNVNTALYVGLDVALNAPNDFNLGGTVNEYKDAISALNENIYLGSASNPHTSYLSDMYAENYHPLVKAVLMSASETQFILAEASTRGWISGDAFDFYKNGIEISLNQYDIADGDSSSVYDVENNTLVPFNQDVYIANVTQLYNESSNKLAVIMHQKWIANWLTAESWFDWRRTGFPVLNNNIISGTNGQNTPQRFWYDDPYNEEHMLEAIQGLQPSTNDQWSKMWLLQ